VNIRAELQTLVRHMNESGITYAEAVAEFKKIYLEETLAARKGNQSVSAKDLGVHRNTLARQIKQLAVSGANRHRDFYQAK